MPKDGVLSLGEELSLEAVLDFALSFQIILSSPLFLSLASRIRAAGWIFLGILFAFLHQRLGCTFSAT